MPIEGLSDRTRIPRLGKIHLGYRDEKKKGAPTATPYFVLNNKDLEAKYGDKPTELPIMFPCEDPDVFASQYYRRYSQTRGLICRGDGKTCWRVTDMDTGGLVSANTKPDRITMVPSVPCPGQECPEYKAKNCKELMCLQFLLPGFPGLGVWQIDTGSINAILNINSMLRVLKSIYGRVSFIPLLLVLEPQTVISPVDTKKKTVHVMNLKIKETLIQAVALANRPIPQLIAGKALPVADSEPVEVFDGEEVEALAESEPESLEAEIDIGWPEEKQEKLQPTPEKKQPAKLKPEAKKPESTKPTQEEKPTRESFMKMTFKNPGEFYTGCYIHFGLQKTQVDKEVPEYDLTNAKQRAEAWQQIVGTYYRE